MKLRAIASILSLILMSAAASAAPVSAAAPANFSFSGTFAHDNDVQLFHFTVGATSVVTLRSWSYAGGVNAAGQTIARGGFDPILSLFNATGKLIGEQDDAYCGPTGVPNDAVTRECYDTRFSMKLNAGNYTASVQQWNNFSRGRLEAGFTKDAAAFQNFRNGFVDFRGNKRDGHWAFDILNVSAANIPVADVPEPASLALLGLGLAGLMAARRRKAV